MSKSNEVAMPKLKLLYETIKYSNTDEEELISSPKSDITDLYYAELEDRIRLGEKIDHQLNGNVRGGKSVTAQALTKYVNEVLIGKKMDIKYITADHLDFMRKTKDINVENCCYSIDEFNPMASVGLNATTEQKVWEHFSEIQANRLIHTYSCSPSGITDKQADIILEPRFTDKKNFRNNCIVRYRAIEAFGVDYKIIGHIWVDVKPVLQAKWYQIYLIKKDAKINLFVKNNIKDPREIEAAEIILDVYNQLKDIAKIMKISRDYISSYAQASITEKQQQLSFFGINDIVSKVKGLLEQITAIDDLNKTISSANNSKSKINYSDREIKDMQTTLQKMESNLSKILGYYNNLINTYETYKKIDEMKITNKHIAEFTRSKRLLKLNNLINKS